MGRKIKKAQHKIKNESNRIQLKLKICINSISSSNLVKSQVQQKTFSALLELAYVIIQDHFALIPKVGGCLVSFAHTDRQTFFFFFLSNTHAPLISFALRIMLAIINDLLPEHFASTKTELFEPLWAVRPGHGKMYGKKYITDYKPFIKNLFEQGAQDESRKMSPSRMIQSIEEDPTFKLRLDHPTENEIRSYISSLIQSAKRKRKRNEDMDNPDGQGVLKGRLSVTDEEIEFITKTARETPEIKPAAFYESFVSMFPKSELNMSQVKSKFSQCKLKNKK